MSGALSNHKLHVNCSNYWQILKYLLYEFKLKKKQKEDYKFTVFFHAFCDTWNQGSNGTTVINLKFVTHTDRMPASAAALHATGTTSETCRHLLK
jgi:hypothetical protein